MTVGSRREKGTITHGERKTAIIVSPYFPPSTLAGVHRARHMAKHLPAHGWRPIIVRVDPKHYTELPDPALAELVPPSVPQVHTGALPARWMRLIGIGDLSLRTLPFLARAMEKAIRSERPDVVFLTGSPYYPLLLSGWVKRRFGLPVVIDLQDPWVSAYGATHPLASKRGLAHRLAVALEPRALHPADAVTSVSETQNQELRARYSFLAGRAMEAIPIGGDPEDFEALRLAPPRSVISLDPNKINISYVGTFLPRAVLLARTLLRALAKLASEKPRLAERIRFNFVGTSNQPNHVTDAPVTALAREEGMSRFVFEIPRRLPFLEALSVLARSAGLLLVGSDEPHYTASKIYPALMSGRPYLSLFHASSSAHSILAAAGGGRAFSFASSEELEALTPAISHALMTLAEHPEKFGRADQAAYAHYTAHATTGRFAALFDTLSQTR